MENNIDTNAIPSGDFPYADIVSLTRPVSDRHKPMPISERAAQFAPFAALTGYGDIVHETARLTERRIELEEDVKEELNRTIQLLMAQVCSRGCSEILHVTYFRPDARKEGGSYRTVTGRIVKFPSDQRSLILQPEQTKSQPVSAECIPIADILSLSLD
jgi:hypothetical protein